MVGFLHDRRRAGTLSRHLHCGIAAAAEEAWSLVISCDKMIFARPSHYSRQHQMCIYICILAFPALSKCCSDSVRGTGQGGAPATVHKVYLHLELKELYSRSGAKKR